MRPRFVRSIDDWSRVERQIATWGELEREMRCGRSWAPITEGAVFARFWSAALMLLEAERPAPGGLVLVGIDHGLLERRQYACCSVAYRYADHQEVWALSEYAPPDATTPLADGEGVVRMVLASGISGSSDPLTALRAVDIWVGDRPIQRHIADVQKSNRRLLGGIRAYLSQHYGREVRAAELPQALRAITTPKKRAGSAWTSISFLQDLMIQGNTRFSLAVPELVTAVQTWGGALQADGKDRIDGWRYPIEVAMRHYGVWRW